MHQARLWKPLKDDRVQCRLCSHFCRIEPGLRGKCAVRENRDGKLYTLVYDRVAAINLDPVEKKPLYHFMPGTKSLSIGTMGCNLACSFCQNYTLSQTPRLTGDVSGRNVPPDDLVAEARDLGAASISYTYSEPTIFFELMADTAAKAQKAGIKNIMVSNGFMSPQCLDELAPLIQAINVDLKAFTEKFYQGLCGAKLKPVKDNLVKIKKLGWWLEVTTLVIPGKNDDPKELDGIARFIHDHLGDETPWHVSRFHPTYKLTDRGPTPVSTLEAAYELGKKAGLKYVYPGNVPGHEHDNTYCPSCKNMVIQRRGFFPSNKDLVGGKCGKCGAAIAGVDMHTLK